MKTIFSKRAFSFIELIVSVLLITIIGTASYTTVINLTKTSESSRNRTMAVNLLQKSMEEVRRVAQTNYDLLENCQFPADQNSPNPCGFDTISNSFPDFTRTLSVANEQGSGELKRAVVSVTFKELGQIKSLESATSIARPADPLPGNIIGRVKDKTTGKFVSSSRVKIINTATGDSHETTSSANLNAKNANFDFIDFQSGRFILSPGNWNLSVGASGYVDYTHPPPPITIGSNQEVFVEIELEQRPKDATIFGQALNRLSGQAIASFPNTSIGLYRNGQRLDFVNNRANYNFTVTFDPGVTQRCFTLASTTAFRAGYALRTAQGGSPSCLFDYNPQGWSSALVQDNGSLVCSNSYLGNSSTDRVCVKPGENKNVNMLLDPVPEVMLQGQVVDQSGQPVVNATVSALWPANVGGIWIKTATSDTNGNFSLSAPAVQGMFPNGTPAQFYLSVSAQGKVLVQTCCLGSQLQTKKSQSVLVGPLFPGDPPRNIGQLIIPTTTANCGNVDGNISDFKTGSGVTAAQVTIVENTTTGGNGQYLFSCPAQGYRLPTGNHAVQTTHPNYYTFNSQGNQWYAPQSPANVLLNQLIHYDARLWPLGFGQIAGTVRDAGTGNPLANASLTLSLYNGSNISIRTNANGTFLFNNVIETWPPPDLPISAYFRRTTQIHHSHVTHDSGFYLPYDQDIDSLIKNQTLNLDIKLIPQGQL